MAQDDVIHQTANSVRRKPEQFISSFKEGGLNVIQSFTLKQVKPIYSKMSDHLLNHPMTLQILYPLLFPQNLQNGITRSTDQLHCTSYLHQ